MVNLAKLYKERYYVSPLDLADYAETNRLHILIACPLLFLFGLGDLIFLFCLHYQNLQDYISSILYFGFFTLISVVVWVYSVKVKNVAREKAYILKSLPIYTFFCIGIAASIYNFYVLGQPYNGVLAYIMTDIIVISIFTISPIFFFIVIALGLAVLIPGVYSNFGVTGLMDTILIAILLHGFSLYRRYSEKKSFCCPLFLSVSSFHK